MSTLSHLQKGSESRKFKLCKWDFLDNQQREFSPISEDVGYLYWFCYLAGRLQMALTILILFNYNDSIELKNIEIYAPIFFKHNILSKNGVKGSSYIFINKRDYTSHKRPMINDVLSTINEWWFKSNWGMGSFFA